MQPALLVALAAFGAPRCETAAVRLDWVRDGAASGCPDGATVAREVIRKLGCDPFGEEARLRLEASVGAQAVGWAATIHIFDDAGAALGVRTLESKEEACEVLGDAAALTLALLAETLGGAVPVPRIEVEPASAVTRVVVKQVTETATVTARPPFAGAAAVRAVLSAGTFPGPRVGVELAARVAAGSTFDAGAGMTAYPSVREGDFGFGLFAGWLEGCAHVGPAEGFRAGGCLRALAGAMTAVVYAADDLVRRDPGSFAWVAVEPLVRASAGLLAPVWVEVEAGALISISRLRFEVAGEAPALSEPAVALQAAAGVGLSF